jgi:menaquinone-dependent protoporphyrinogen oxidase
MTVLVTYASRHGATTEIAEALGRDLRSHGVDAEVRSADEVDGVEPYDAVVLGSAIYLGKWLPEATALAERCAGRPVWLFSSGPLGDPLQPAPPELESLVQRTRAREHRVFAGRLDRASLSFPERAIVRMVKAPYGDYRDFAAVADFASTIAQSIA